jgi:hypothetical protein
VSPIFCVLAHTEPTQIRRLIDRLHPHRVVIHVDGRRDIENFAGLPRTTYVEPRVAVRWGGFSVVDATLLLYEKALETASTEDHLVLLSGQCYPTTAVDVFARYLASCSFGQHCRAGMVFDGTAAAERMRKRWFFDELPTGPGPSYAFRAGARWLLKELSPRRRPVDFAPYTPVAGSQWTALTAECVADILPVARSPHYRRLFSHTLAPDESYFQTLVWNTFWRSDVFDPGPSERGGRSISDYANFHYIDRSLAGYRTIDDLAAATKPGYFFTRKVHPVRSAHLLDTLDRLAAESHTSDG